MRKVKLGHNGPIVSEVCFGSLAISPLQGRVTEEQGRDVLRYAFSRGIDWVDTAEIYDNYSQLRPVLKEYPNVKIVTKSYAVTKSELYHSLEKARLELERDVIDIFLLHEQENHLTLKGHAEAWEALLECKEKGLVGNIGISTHAVQGVKAGALQPGLDIIHPLINYQGLGIIDGSLDQMIEAINFAAELGIGIYAMKVLGGGHLANQPEKALIFIKQLKSIHAMALGMTTYQEVDFNLAILAGEEVSVDLRKSVIYRERKLYIADWCQGCGNCVKACQQGALVLQDSRVHLIATRCILCGYCGGKCPHFCLKIV